MTTSSAPGSGGRQLSLAGDASPDSEASPDSAASLVPAAASPTDLAIAAAGCQACDLWGRATQTVFGAGPATAAVMFVGEQPGDVEDREGAPFVGPAGRVFDQALEAAGIAQKQIGHDGRVTGLRRPAETPMDEKWSLAMPAAGGGLTLAGGPASAARPSGVQGRGRPASPGGRRSTNSSSNLWFGGDSPLAPQVLATVHPSSILRAPDDQRAAALQGLVDDLAVVAALLA